MKQNIFLIGFMGSGKSHWGRIWAKKNGLSFYDLDEQVESDFGMSVEQIFEKHSEGKFRELERHHLREFGNKKNYLLSCGGGTPCFFDNLKWMAQHGIIIYLKASPDYILERVMDETLKRPLLKEVNASELLFFIETKLKEREQKYLKAHHVLEVTELDPDSLKFLQKQVDKKENVEKKKEIKSSAPKKVNAKSLQH